MIRLWLAVAGVGGFASVAAGAVAAHLAGAPHAAELLRTGALYGLVHAAALAAAAGLAAPDRRPGVALAVAGCGFALGIVLFSLSLFALALSGVGWFGRVTPFGGGALMVGWIAMAVAGLRRL